MHWQVFLSTFVAIFLAELGDKTQVATFTMVAGGESAAKWSVFLGASVALIATSALAVGFGSLLGSYVSPVWIKRVAGSVFIVLGVVYLADSF